MFIFAASSLMDMRGGELSAFSGAGGYLATGAWTGGAAKGAF